MCKDGCNHKPKQAERGSISLKFNSGLPALLYRGEGLALLSDLGLHTEHELEHERTVRRLSSEQNAARVKELEDMIAERDDFAIARNDLLTQVEAERGALKARVEAVESLAASHLAAGAARWEERNAARAERDALRAELAAAQAREARLRNLLDGIAAAFEDVIAEEDRPKNGMHVPFHGEFSAALRLPSVMAGMRWWVREFRAALAEKPEKT